MTRKTSTKPRKRSTVADRPGEAEFLAAYEPRAYAPVSVTVDLAIFTIRENRLCMLLVERADHPYKGFWALPGGFIDPNEDAEAAALRELGEETGMDPFPGHIEQLRTYSTPDRDPRTRVISVAFVAFAPNLSEPVAGSDAAQAKFFPVDELPALAFDHDEIMADALERVRSKLEYTSLATEFVAQPFTIPELYRVYEAVWGFAPDLPNFRRKVMSTNGFVVKTGKKRSGPGEDGKPRPPQSLFKRGRAVQLNPAMTREQVQR